MAKVTSKLQVTVRQRERERTRPLAPASERGWTREDLYEPDRAR